MASDAQGNGQKQTIPARKRDGLKEDVDPEEFFQGLEGLKVNDDYQQWPEEGRSESLEIPIVLEPDYDSHEERGSVCISKSCHHTGELNHAMLLPAAEGLFMYVASLNLPQGLEDNDAATDPGQFRHLPHMLITEEADVNLVSSNVPYRCFQLVSSSATHP